MSLSDDLKKIRESYITKEPSLSDRIKNAANISKIIPEQSNASIKPFGEFGEKSKAQMAADVAFSNTTEKPIIKDRLTDYWQPPSIPLPNQGMQIEPGYAAMPSSDSNVNAQPVSPPPSSIGNVISTEEYKPIEVNKLSDNKFIPVTQMFTEELGRRDREIAQNQYELENLADELALKYGLRDRESIALLIGKGFVQGTEQLAMDAGTNLRILGNITNNRQLQSFGDGVYEVFKEKYDKEAPEDKTLSSMSFKDMLNPAWYVYNVSKILPNVFATYELAGVGMSGTTKAVGVLSNIFKNIKPSNIIKLSQMGGALLGGSFGGSLEQAGYYRTAKELGASDKDATIGAIAMGGVSSALNYLNVLSFLGNKGMNTVALNEMITEWLEEPASGGLLYKQKLITLQDAIDRSINGIVAMPLSYITSYIAQGMSSLNVEVDAKATTEQKQNVEEFKSLMKNNAVSVIDGSKIIVSDDISLGKASVYNPSKSIGKVQKTSDTKIINNGDINKINKDNRETLYRNVKTEPHGRKPYQIIFDRFVTNKIAQSIDVFAHEWSMQFNQKEKNEITRIYKDYMNLEFSLNKQSEPMLKKFQELLGGEEEYKAFRLYDEDPTLHPVENTKENKNQKDRFDTIRKIKMQFSGEEMQITRELIDNRLNILGEKYGKYFSKAKMQEIMSLHQYYAIFPNQGTIAMLRNKIKDIDADIENISKTGGDIAFYIDAKEHYTKTLEHLQRRMSETRYSEKTIIPSKKKDVTAGKKNLKVQSKRYIIRDNMDRIVESFDHKSEAEDFISDKGGFIIQYNPERTSLYTGGYNPTASKEHLETGRIELWSYFFDLPQDVQDNYLDPAQSALLYTIRSGQKYAINKWVNEMLEAPDMIMSEDDPRYHENLYSDIPADLVKAFPELSGLKMNNLALSYINQKIIQTKADSGKNHILFGIRFFSNLALNLQIMDPTLMARLNAQQLGMIHPLLPFKFANALVMMAREPKKFTKLVGASYNIGTITGDLSSRESTSYQAEDVMTLAKKKESLETDPVFKKLFRKWLYNNIEPSEQDINTAYLTFLSAINTSRNIAFDLGDVTAKVALTEWLLKDADTAIKNGEDVDVKSTFTDYDGTMTMEDRKRLQWAKDKAEALGLVKTMSDYSIQNRDYKKFVNIFSAFWQIRQSNMSGVRNLIGEAADGNDDAKKLLAYQIMLWILGQYFAGMFGYGKEKYYKFRKNDSFEDELFVQMTELNNALDEHESFDQYWKDIDATEMQFSIKNLINLPNYAGRKSSEILLAKLFKKETSRKVMAVRKMIEEGEGTKDLTFGGAINVVSLDPLSLNYATKILGKGAKGGFPSDSPFFFALGLLNSSEDIGVFKDGDYKILAKKNESFKNIISASATKYFYEKVGVVSVLDEFKGLFKDDEKIPRELRIASIIGNSMFVYRKNGKTYSELKRNWNKISSHPSIVNAITYDRNGVARDDMQQENVIRFTRGLMYQDQNLGVGYDRLYAMEKFFKEKDLFGSGKENYASESKYIKKMFLEASRNPEYLDKKALLNIMQRHKDEIQIDDDEKYIAVKKIVIEEAFKYINKYRTITEQEKSALIESLSKTFDDAIDDYSFDLNN